MKRWWRWGLVLIWMGIIFAFSSQPNSNKETENYFGAFNYFARKSAHMLEYAILFVLSRWALSSESAPSDAVNKSSFKCDLQALLLVVLYAGSDEWHQSFVPGRSAMLSDVGIDTTGALIAAALRQLAVVVLSKLRIGRQA